jgi:hypothetical protein
MSNAKSTSAGGNRDDVVRHRASEARASVARGRYDEREDADGRDGA